MTPIDGRSILTAAQMREAETAHGDLAALMDRAGCAVAAAVRQVAAGAEVLVLCGPGNNGGDGYVAAAALRAAGHPVRVAAIAAPHSPLAAAARDRWTGPVETADSAAAAPVLVDALFGTGLSRSLDPAATGALRRLTAAARLTIAVDLPSGVATDDGTILGDPPGADLTLALGAAKPSHLLQPAARLCGEVRLLDIGIDADGPVRAIARPVLVDPGPDAHKYARGMVAVVPGAMAGAAALAASAAMRAGAGYALLMAEGEGPPHAIVRHAFDADALRDERIGAVVIGPGLGRGDDAQKRLAAALASGRPLVLDGDALRLLTPDRIAAIGVPRILTPHGGEFAALFGDGGGGKIDRARDAACRAGAIVVFKGADTVVAAPDGRVVVAGGASAWLSTAGSGDVLAGAVGAMLAAGGDAFDAAAAAVWLHAEAARLLGKSFIADDLANRLTAARAARAAA